jgi:hypothetical protein
MDPNANLREQNDCNDPARLRELRQELAGWLDVGGFAPDWQQCPLAAKGFKSWLQERYQPLYRRLMVGLVDGQ